MPWYPGTMRSKDACMKANSRMDVCLGVSPMDQQAFEATRRLEPGGRSGNSDIDTVQTAPKGTNHDGGYRAGTAECFAALVLAACSCG